MNAASHAASGGEPRREVGDQESEAAVGTFDAAALDSRGGTLRPLMFFLAGLTFLATIAMVFVRRRTEAGR